MKRRAEVIETVQNIGNSGSEVSDRSILTLVIEDNPISSRVLLNHLERTMPELKIIAVTSIQEASEVLNDYKIDLIIADYHLDDGVVSDLSHYYSDLTVIVISANTKTEDIIQEIKSGAFDYLIKDSQYTYLKTLEIAIPKALQNKKNQILLKESIERYNDLFHQTTDLIQSVDAEGKIIFANQAWEKTLGYVLTDDETVYIKEVIHPKSIAACNALFKSLLEGAATKEVELSFLTKEGKELILKGNVTAKYENGKMVATRGIFHDITTLREQEKELKESKAFIEGVIDNIPEIIYSLDSELKVLFISRKAFDLFGFLQEDLQTVSFFLLPHILPEDTPRYMQMLEQIRQGQTYRQEYRILDESGNVRWIEDSGHPVFNETGELIRVDGSLFDITSTKENQRELERLSVVANKTESYVVITNAQHEIEWINESFTKITGYAIAEAVGKLPSALLQVEDEQSLLQVTSKLRTGQYMEGVYWVWSKDGVRKCLSFQATPIFDENGELEQVIGIGNDITRKQQNEEQIKHQHAELVKMKQQLEEANKQLTVLNSDLEGKVKERTSELTVLNERLRLAARELDQFYYRTSHNLRAPIARLMGLASLGRVETQDKLTQQYFDLLVQSAKEMDRMLENIQNLNHISDLDATRNEEISIWTLVQGQFDDCHIQSPEIDARLTCGGGSEMIVCNPTLLIYALSPILKNAFDHFDKKGPLLVEARLTDTDEAWMLQLANSGSYIDQEISNRVFDMFFVASERYQGNGLGLFIAQKAMQKMGGAITLVSTEGGVQDEVLFELKIPK